MFDTKKIEEMARKFGESLPPAFAELRKEAEERFGQVMQSGVSKMDLVTREEFDAQTQVLLKTREKLEQLEKKLDELENR